MESTHPLHPRYHLSSTSQIPISTNQQHYSYHPHKSIVIELTNSENTCTHHTFAHVCAISSTISRGISTYHIIDFIRFHMWIRESTPDVTKSAFGAMGGGKPLNIHSIPLSYLMIVVIISICMYAMIWFDSISSDLSSPYSTPCNHQNPDIYHIQLSHSIITSFNSMIIV